MGSAVKIYKHFETPKNVGVYHRLICLTGENKGKAYFIIGKRIVLGRSEAADVQILDIKSSREHAEIILVGKEFILTDLGSQNGVVVNDLKIKQHVLGNGDKIIIGKTVYKFSRVEVKDTKPIPEKEDKLSVVKKGKADDIDDDEEDEEENQGNRMTLILAAVIVIAGALLIGEDNTNSTKKVRKQIQNDNLKEITDIVEKTRKLKSKEAKKQKEKLNYYFQRGLREYREGNYFRAINEFEAAKQWSPSDPLASFYLRKTKEKLDETIESYFNKALRDIEAVNFQPAINSYCSVIRMLQEFPEHEKFLAAKGALAKIEKDLGMEEGEITCVEVDK